MNFTFVDEHGAELDACNRFRLGNFSKPVLSCGIRVTRGTVIHLEMGNSYMQPPVLPGEAPRRIPLVLIGNSFYARVRVRAAGAAPGRVAPVVAQPAPLALDDEASHLEAKLVEARAAL